MQIPRIKNFGPISTERDQTRPSETKRIGYIGYIGYMVAWLHGGVRLSVRGSGFTVFYRIIGQGIVVFKSGVGKTRERKRRLKAKS
jgi:hypothetical protein